MTAEELLPLVENRLNQKEFQNKTFLLAFSAGLDSTVLAYLMQQTNISFEMAHMNYGLRLEADEDEAFARRYAKRINRIIHTKKVDVAQEKSSGNFSTQMAARNLRHQWFHEIMQQNKLDYLILAHHLDDALETFIMHLFRGSGLNGLVPMGFQIEHMIRPIFDVPKQVLLQFAQSHHIQWREDSSNQTTHYFRNQIRHQVIPSLKEIDENFMDYFKQTQNHLANEKRILNELMQKETDKLSEETSSNETHYSIEKIKNLQPNCTWLHFIFGSKGFHYQEVEKLIDKSLSGSRLENDQYALYKDRAVLILQKQMKKETNQWIIKEKSGRFLNYCLDLSEQKNEKALEVLDAHNIKWPLSIRSPQEGDFFYPLGMNQKKKLSKFFKDEKYTAPMKKEALVLIDADNQILWIVGKRIDNRFKITESTVQFLNITLCE